MSKRFAGWLCAIVLAGLPLSVQAQQPSAANLALAKQVVALKGATTMFDPVVAALIERVKAQYQQANPLLSKDLDEIAQKLAGEYANRKEDIINESVRLYAGEFTEPELKSIVAFYSSPIGKKIVNTEPRILDQTLKFADQWSTKLSQDMIIRFREEMKKRGHDI